MSDENKEEQAKPAAFKQLQRIDINADHFVVEATGKRYWKTESLSVDRYMYYETLEVQLGFGKTFASIFDEIGKAMKDINAQLQGEAYVKLYNLANGVQGKMGKYPFVMRYCALVFNEDDEDPGEITEQRIAQKINEWKSLDVEPFFSFAISSLPGFKERYIQLTQAISPKNQTEDERNS